VIGRSNEPPARQTSADDHVETSLSLSECVGDYKSAGVVSDVQLYLGLLVCANGKTGGSMRYHVSRTTVASCATDMAQYGIL